MGLATIDFSTNIPWITFAVLLGNTLYSKASWRWIFIIAAIYAFVCLIGIALVYFPPSRPQADYDKGRLQELREVDWTGIILYTGGLTSL
jgi:MFS family permease